MIACLVGLPAARADEGASSLQAQVEDLLKQQPMPQASELTNGDKAANAGKRQAWRVGVSLGQLDPRMRLAPCDRVKAYLPSGAQLWGRTRVGLRCEQGSVRWNVY